MSFSSNPSAMKIRAAIVALDRPSPNSRYPEDIKAMVVAHMRERLACGAAFRSVVRELGLCKATVRNWLATAGRGESRAEASRAEAAASPEAERVFLPVKVSSAGTDGGLVLVTPGGYRIEGLGLTSASELLARLRQDSQPYTCSSPDSGFGGFRPPSAVA